MNAPSQEINLAFPPSPSLPIDDGGKVSVWHLVEAKWKRLCPIDAKEQLDRGIVSLSAPSGSDGPPEVPKPEEFDPNKASLPELRGYAESRLGILGAEAMNKREILTAIRACMDSKSPRQS